MKKLLIVFLFVCCGGLHLPAMGKATCNGLKKFRSGNDITEYVNVEYLDCVEVVGGTSEVYRRTPIETAVYEHNVDAVEALLNAKPESADTGRYTKPSITMLELINRLLVSGAYDARNVTIAEKLIDAGANVNAISTDCYKGINTNCTLFDQVKHDAEANVEGFSELKELYVGKNASTYDELYPKKSYAQQQSAQVSVDGYTSQKPFWGTGWLNNFYMRDNLSAAAKKARNNELEEWKKECESLPKDHRDLHIAKTSVDESFYAYYCEVAECEKGYTSNDDRVCELDVNGDGAETDEQTGNNDTATTTTESGGGNTEKKSDQPALVQQAGLVTIGGKVVDTNGNGIKSVIVQIVDSSKFKVLKNAKGKDLQDETGGWGGFKIKDVPQDAFIHIIKSGYQDQYIKVGGFTTGTKVTLISLNAKICKSNEDHIAEGVEDSFACSDAGQTSLCDKCNAVKCMDGYAIKEGVKTKSPNQCVECNLTNFAYDNASKVDVSDGVSCVITSCNDGFHPSDDKKECVVDTDSDSGDDGDTKCQLKVGQNNIKSIDSENCVITGCDNGYTISNDKKYCISPDAQKKLEEAQQAYDEAKEKEQSLANRTLTAATTAATGIGAMQLAQGLSEQRADREAAADMAAYIATFRCDYANGKSVRASSEEIELPGGNNQNLMNYRAEYLALASDLKERKTALNMKPGIESEEILDKTNLGLYEDENVGITSGAEASLYRAQMLKSEQDQAKIDEMSAESSKRVKGGAIAAGLGVVGGVLGDSLINGELGNKLKDVFKDKNVGTNTKKLLSKEKDALDDLKKCLKDAGVQDADNLEFKYFYPSVLSVRNINCKRDLTNQIVYNGSVSDLFADSTDADKVFESLTSSFPLPIVGKMIGYSLTNTSSGYQHNMAQKHLEKSIKNVEDKFKEAEDDDKKSISDLGIDLGGILGNGTSLKDLMSGTDLSSVAGFLN